MFSGKYHGTAMAWDLYSLLTKWKWEGHTIVLTGTYRSFADVPEVSYEGVAPDAAPDALECCGNPPVQEVDQDRE